MDTKTAMSRGFMTRRRITISGIERAVMAIMNASAEPTGRPFAEERLDDRDRARGVAVERDAEDHERRDGERVVAAADRDDEVGRDEAVDERADARSRRRRTAGRAERCPAVERQASRTRSSRVGLTSAIVPDRVDLPDVVLDVALEVRGGR